MKRFLVVINAKTLLNDKELGFFAKVGVESRTEAEAGDLAISFIEADLDTQNRIFQNFGKVMFNFEVDRVVEDSEVALGRDEGIIFYDESE